MSYRDAGPWDGGPPGAEADYATQHPSAHPPALPPPPRPMPATDPWTGVSYSHYASSSTYDYQAYGATNYAAYGYDANLYQRLDNSYYGKYPNTRPVYPPSQQGEYSYQSNRPQLTSREWTQKPYNSHLRSPSPVHAKRDREYSRSHKRATSYDDEDREQRSRSRSKRGNKSKKYSSSDRSSSRSASPSRTRRYESKKGKRKSTSSHSSDSRRSRSDDRGSLTRAKHRNNKHSRSVDAEKSRRISYKDTRKHHTPRTPSQEKERLKSKDMKSHSSKDKRSSPVPASREDKKNKKDIVVKMNALPSTPSQKRCTKSSITPPKAKKSDRSSLTPPRAYRSKDRSLSPTGSYKIRESSVTPPKSYLKRGSSSSSREFRHSTHSPTPRSHRSRSKQSALSHSSTSLGRSRSRSHSRKRRSTRRSLTKHRSTSRSRSHSERRRRSVSRSRSKSRSVSRGRRKEGRKRRSRDHSRSSNSRSHSGSRRRESRSRSRSDTHTPSDEDERRGQFTVADRKKFWKLHNTRQEEMAAEGSKNPSKEHMPPPGAVEPATVDDIKYGDPPEVEGPNFEELPPPPDQMYVRQASTSKTKVPLPIKNDGSFLEMFKKMQGETKKDSENAKPKPEIKKAVLPFIGKRRGGRVLKTGLVKKAKAIDEQPADNNPKDAWSLYMQEVKKYRETSCEEERKTRPLVK